MDYNTFLLSVFPKGLSVCIVDDWLEGQRLRERGPQPILSDGEVLTIEIMGEWLGIDTDQGLFTHFRRYHAKEFPSLHKIKRTTFLRQAANLCLTKARLWQHLLNQIGFDTPFSLVDSFPVPVGRFARAKRCRNWAGLAAFGYDEMAKQTFYGLRAHLRVCWPGVIVGIHLASANVLDVEAVSDVREGTQGWLLGDRNYWSPKLRRELRQFDVQWLTPYQSSQREAKPWPRWLIQKRRRIETVMGQWVERFHAKRVWARDLWHLCSRWCRKVPSHTISLLLCQQTKLPPLNFAELVAD